MVKRLLSQTIIIGTKTPQKKLVLFDIDYTLFDTDILKKSNLSSYSLYIEVPDVLRKILQVAQIGIFSEGKEEFQHEKIKKTELVEIFLDKNVIHITDKKEDELENILTRYKDRKMYMVDDKLSILHKAHQLNPGVFTIWIRRGPYAKNEKNPQNFTPNAIINTLQELIPIVATE